MNTQTNPMPGVWDVKAKLTANAMKQRLPRTPRAAYKPKPTMLKHEITAGIGYDANGRQLYPKAAIASVRAMLAAEFGGYSELAAFGSYTHLSGIIVVEESRTWVIITDKPVIKACEFIRDALKQESVLWVTSPVHAQFVKAHV